MKTIAIILATALLIIVSSPFIYQIQTAVSISLAATFAVFFILIGSIIKECFK